MVPGLVAVTDSRKDAICDFVGSADYCALEFALRSAMEVLAIRLRGTRVANERCARLGREHGERRAVLETMGGARGEERCSYRPQQHGCNVEVSCRRDLSCSGGVQEQCPNKLALLTF